MVWDVKTVKGIHLDVLSRRVDIVLEDDGFKRSKSSTVYRRKSQQVEQSLDIFARLTHPNGGDCSHVTGVIRIVMPEINAIASTLAQDDISLLCYTDGITLSSPLGMAGPKRAYQEWIASNQVEYEDAGVDVAHVVREYALPFLRDYTNPHVLITSVPYKI